MLTVYGANHTFDVKAPQLNAERNILTVSRQSDFSETTTARVRAIGVTDWESEEALTFNDKGELKFDLDSDWIAQNKGKSVLFNYSLRLRPSDSHFLFSQLLRLNPF